MPKASDVVTISKPVILANNQAGPTVFHDEASKTEVTWEGAGDSQGRDIQPVPVHYLENINFLRILNKGIFSLVSAPDEVKDLLDQYLSNPTLVQQRANYKQEQTDRVGVAVTAPARPDFVFPVDHVPGYNETESLIR
jgi:hypothetical protein